MAGRLDKAVAHTVKHVTGRGVKHNRVRPEVLRECLQAGESPDTRVIRFTEENDRFVLLQYHRFVITCQRQMGKFEALDWLIEGEDDLTDSKSVWIINGFDRLDGGRRVPGGF